MTAEDSTAEALARTVAAAKKFEPWFTQQADDVLARIKTDTTEDVLLYHDAVSVLVGARDILRLLAMQEIPEPPTDDERGQWTDARIREAFIDDGGLSEYHDPIHGAATQRRVMGGIFDAWLAERDRRHRGSIADDEREALRQVVVGSWKAYQEMQDDPEFGGDFEDILAHRLSLAGWSNRPRGPIRPQDITDEVVHSALHKFYDQEERPGYEWRAPLVDNMRSALEAARDAQ